MRDAHDIEIDETEGKDRNALRAMLYQAWGDLIAREKRAAKAEAEAESYAGKWEKAAEALDISRETVKSLEAKVAELEKWRDIAREEGEDIRKLERKLHKAESDACMYEQDADAQTTLRCLYQRRARALQDELVKAKGGGIAWVPGEKFGDRFKFYAERGAEFGKTGDHWLDDGRADGVWMDWSEWVRLARAIIAEDERRKEGGEA